jgi:hypothetical protein
VEMRESCGSWQLSQARSARQVLGLLDLTYPTSEIFARHFHGADYLVGSFSHSPFAPNPQFSKVSPIMWTSTRD